jgi:copper transport protein
MRPRTALRATPLALCMLLAVTTAALAHTALRSSSPAADERLTVSPTELRLRFTSAVDARLARIVLKTADSSAIRLDSLRAGSASDEIVAPVPEALAAGEFTLSWQVIGTDGHPVRGRFAFVVDPPVDTAAAPPANPELGIVDDPETQPRPADGEQTSAVQSPGHVATRWLTFATILVIIGATVFRTFVLESARNRSTVPTGSAADDAAARAARLGRGAAMFLLLTAGARYLLQARAIEADGMGGDLMGVVLFDTPWGWGWFLQVAAAALALFAFHRAAGNPRSGWGAAMIAGLALAFTPALSGHAVGSETAPALAVAIDGVHVFAASAWMGTLLALVAAGVPAAVRGGGGTTMVADLVATFSPMALTFAAVVIGTGAVSAILHLDAISQLWLTPYGRTLLLKLGAVALVLAVGAWNWRAVRPRLAATGPAPLRRTAPFELLAAAIVLVLTAVLVATPTP